MKNWNIDPDHSVAPFKVRHLMIAFVHGQFNKLKGTVHFDPDNPSTFSLDVSIDASGIYTGISKRDEHLKSPDFFDVATYPEIIFKSTGFSLSGSGGKLTGDLSIHGVTKSVILEVSLSGPVKSPEELGGETTMGITATASINREDFGMAWNVPLNGDGKVVGTEIMIDLNIEADMEE